MRQFACIILMVISITLLATDNILFIQMKQVATSQIPKDMLIPELGDVVVDTQGTKILECETSVSMAITSTYSWFKTTSRLKTKFPL
jgi:hypothetical protein